MYSLTFPILSIFMIVICTLSSVSSDCASCCLLTTSCSTAYNGEPGQCCAYGLSSYCCPTSSVCTGNNQCRILYWGMSLGVLIGVIAGIIIGSILLIAVLRSLCRGRSPPVTHTMVLAPAYHDPGVYQIPAQPTAAYRY